MMDISTTDVGLVATGGMTTGNERYMLELAGALLRRNEFDYSVFYTRDAVRQRIAAQSRAPRFHRVWSESKLVRQTVALPVAIRRSRVRLIHSQYGLPAFTCTPSVVMLPDVYFARHPEHHPRLQRLQLGYRVPHALKRARRIIVPSMFTREDVLDLYEVDERKIRLVPHGISDSFRPLTEAELAPVRERHALPEHFILYVGALQPRKNLLRLVQAFGKLSREMRHEFPLVISGARRWLYDDFFAASRQYEEEGTLRLLGFTEEADLPALMNLATVFAFPSLSEGFGFPPLEAMRCGTCVLAARAGSLPELVQNGGMLIDPFSVQEIRDGLVTLLTDPALRERLAGRGRELAQQYTWERTATDTARVYDEVLGSI